MAGEINDTRGKLTELGERIRAQREHLGLSVQEVEEQTKIRSKYLMAIEAGEDKIAPGKAYFRVFLKSYADFLGLDGLEFSRMYQEISAKPKETRIVRRQAVKNGGTIAERRELPQYKTQPEVRRARRRRGKANGSMVTTIVILALMLAVIWGAAKLWQDYLHPGQSNETSDLNNGESLEPGPEPDPDKPGVEPEDTVKVARSEPGQDVTLFETDKTPMEITLTTLPDEDVRCWINVQSDGKLVVEKTMGPNETLEFTAQKEMRVRAGKPWVLTIILNGHDFGTGGPVGPVKDLVFRYNEEM
ncbi:MAG TPA: DUF4115 domain-containing protein [Firmicutes bacterium]|jgi:cytoskeleton protein RodZ|nr:DUF4115 domain-containing protein [Bacillota bacterium]